MALPGTITLLDYLVSEFSLVTFWTYGFCLHMVVTTGIDLLALPVSGETLE